MPGLKQLDLKQRYSFHKFGHQRPMRHSQQIHNSVFRNSMQLDTPYFRDVLEAFNVKHALVDPSHTFVANRPSTKDFKIYTKKKHELTSKELQQTRRVTYDPKGQPIIRLNDISSHSNTLDPLSEYNHVKSSNDHFFRQISKAKNTSDKIKMSSTLTGQPFRISRADGSKQVLNGFEIPSRSR